MSSPSVASNAAITLTKRHSDSTPSMASNPTHVPSTNSRSRIIMTGFDPRKYGSPLAKSKSQENKTPSPLQLNRPEGENHALTNTTTDNLSLVTDTALTEKPLSDSQLPPKEQPNHHNSTKPPEVQTPTPAQTTIESHRPAALAHNKRIQNKVVRTGKTTSNIIMNNHPKPEQDESIEDRLKRVQKEAIERIGIRNMTKDSPHNKITTSLRALQLARKPIQGTQSCVEPAKPVRQPRGEIGANGSLPANNEWGSSIKTTDEANPEQKRSEVSHSVQQETIKSIFSAEAANFVPGVSSEVRLSSGLPVRKDVTQAPKKIKNAVGNKAETWDEQSADRNDGYISTNVLVKSLPLGKQVAQKPLPEPLTVSRARLGKADPSVDSPGTISGADDNEDTQSDDSMKPMKRGNATVAKPVLPAHNLSSWDGKFLPPPVDWNDRPLFKNEHPEMKNGFQNWSTEVIEYSVLKDPEKQFACFPNEDLEDLDLTPDGIGLAQREFTINHLNVHRYYDVRDQEHAREITFYCGSDPIPDGAKNCKLDLREQSNVAIKDETTEALVRNWNAHVEARLAQRTPTPDSGRPSKSTKLAPTPVTNDNNNTTKPPAKTKPWKPKANIYLRPAIKTDIPQLTALYNLHVLHSTRPADCTPLSPSDMLSHYTDVKSDLLPFIIASLKTRTTDTIVGYASAMLLTSSNQIERTTAELELYIHPDHLRLGVGTCLLDRILSVLDLTYTTPGGLPLSYRWHCDPRLATKYSSGGLRNIHKVLFQVRSHTSPRTKPLTLAEKKHIDFHHGLGGVDYSDVLRENDYAVWLKGWLVGRWEFEEQGVLKEVGTKRGRWVDAVYLSRGTGWGPREGQVPEFVEGVDNAHGTGSEGEDSGYGNGNGR